ncbi:cation transporter [Nocardioides aequoreus]|uniref:cation transporter n=1 Tax=Nocardioides aequoreus TaxID=397278 RepID=UPI00247FDAA1|nr:cation transporter [Nocardioides aequoreus]
MATRKDTSGIRTFGSYRAEVFASGLAVLLMLGVAAYVSIAAIGRIGASVEVESGAMLIVGAIGLAVNVAALLLLRGGARESLNVKGAYLEVVADTWVRWG